MMTRGKLVLTLAVALLVCLGLGFAWGGSGRSELRTALDEAQQQLDVAEARGQILDARVSLYNNNFGDAARHLEEAKVPLQRVKQRYQDARNNEAASRIDAALAQIEQAQHLAAKLDPSANTKAGEALDAIKLATGK
jgi:cellobiose-specific phosphotransferase system component IIA